MAWSSLGTVSVDFDAAWFAPAIRGDVLIRLTQSYVPREVTRYNRLYLWEKYPSGDERFLRAFWPTTQPKLVPLTLPKPMRDLGWMEREIGVKHGWAGVVEAANWQCSCDFFEIQTALTVTWQVAEAWETGFAAEISIFNPGPEPISNWAISFGADNVTNVLGAELDDLGGDLWEISSSLTSGGTINPGQTRRVGIVADGPPNLTNLAVSQAIPGDWGSFSAPGDGGEY